VRIYTHPSLLLHDNGPSHPESPARLHAVIQALRTLPDLEWRQSKAAQHEQLRLAHSKQLIEQVLQPVLDDVVVIDPDTRLMSASAEAILHASGAAIDAVDAVMRGESQRAFCAIRPPGHHATAQRAMGFCFTNHVAVAALHALNAHGLKRVAVADFDVHHGNGTADILGSDPRVCFVNSHEAGIYPYDPYDPVYLGEEKQPNTLNARLPTESGSAEFRRAWQEQLLPTLDAFQPELLLISAGFDAHHLDPLAHLNLNADDFAWVTQQLCAIANRHAQGRVVSLLEGGYSLQGLRESVLAHVQNLQQMPQ
jgi:acetoin utilization deacetylase AcuC-like enzyme